MKFYKLFDKTKDNRVKVWTISVTNNGDHSVIETRHGIDGGKMVSNKVVVNSGKNIGRSNETSHYQQALNEAQSKYKKKKDSGYSETLRDKSLSHSPMLAQDFSKHSKKLNFPCYIQPKLDGYRMIFDPVNKKAYTRTGEEYPVFYQTKLYKSLCDKTKGLKYSLDGEFYVHDKSFNFEKYGVLRKTKKLSPEDLISLDKIDYHVYDMIHPTLTFQQRLEILKGIPGITLVETKICKDTACIEETNKKNILEGYEGSMLRNIESLYTPGFRSYDLLKYKLFNDDEFKITGFSFEEDTLFKGKMVLWECQTDEGKKFTVQSTGTKKERKELYKEAQKYIGKLLTVKFFGFTNDGIPRFPKTLRPGKASIRDTSV